MRVVVGQSMVEIVQGELISQNTQAIVNALNSSILGKAGRDGALLRAAGPAVAEEVRKLGNCDMGVAKITSGGKLRVNHIIHAAGPVYRGGFSGEPELLARTYKRSMDVAVQAGVKRIAFPAISVGANGYPPDQAAEVAVRAAIAYLRDHPELLLVRFVLNSKEVYRCFEIALTAMSRGQCAA